MGEVGEAKARTTGPGGKYNRWEGSKAPAKKSSGKTDKD